MKFLAILAAVEVGPKMGKFTLWNLKLYSIQMTINPLFAKYFWGNIMILIAWFKQATVWKW